MNVIINRFFNKEIINPEADIQEIDQWIFWKNVVSIWIDYEIWEIQDFQDEIIAIIDDIIELWIYDYKLEHKESLDFYKESLDFYKETTKIWQEMFNIATWIENTFDYINDTEFWELNFDSNYILDTVEYILKSYRNEVFTILVEKRNAKIVNND